MICFNSFSINNSQVTKGVVKTIKGAFVKLDTVRGEVALSFC